VATVNAYNGYSLNPLNANLSNDVYYGTSRSDYSNFTVEGTTYPSVVVDELNVNGTYYRHVYAGNFSTNASGVVTGGIVSAYYEYYWNGYGWALGASVTNFSYSAVDFYNAVNSGIQSPTTTIVVNILSGNDTITGSTGDDILYGGIGNDVINGGGGTDGAVYLGNRSDYAILREADGRTLVVDHSYNNIDGTDSLYNINYLEFMDQTVAVNSLPVFDGLDYVASYPDLINAFKSAGSQQAASDAGTAHFINSGYNEGRNITFNGLDYIASYGDLINAFGANGDAGAYHYIESGRNEGRKTTFNGLDYIASYGDLINAIGDNEQAGAEHFIDGGYREGRKTTFNGLDYIASYGDLIKALGANEQAGAEHFIDRGYREGRTTTFDGLAYIADYPDLMKAFGANNDAGATHYIQAGFSEHRSTSFDVGAYESAHPDLKGKYASDDAFLTAYINTYKTTGTFLT
jgi:RTX calcium-binding nonapeptide repeat (4 copies)